MLVSRAMVFRLALSLLLMATVFVDAYTVPTETINLTTEDTPIADHSIKNPQRTGNDFPVQAQDPKCPYTGLLLQLLSTLLEFLKTSSESDKVKQIVVVMKSYLQNLPLGTDKDVLLMKLKVIEEQLRREEPFYDYYATRARNGKSPITIAFKTEVPYLDQPKCKTMFTRIVQAAYNNYVNIAKYSKCQNTPDFDEASLSSQKEVPFEITFSHPLNNVPETYNPEGFDGAQSHKIISPYYPKSLNFFSNIQYPNYYNRNFANNNPSNVLSNPRSNLNYILPFLHNLYPKYSDIINQFIKDHPDMRNNLVAFPKFWPHNTYKALNVNPHMAPHTKPSYIANANDLPFNYNPANLMPIMKSAYPLTVDNVTSSPLDFGSSDLNSINILPELNDGSFSKSHDYIMDLLPSKSSRKDSEKLTKGDVDYSVLLGQLGILKPQNNNEQWTTGKNYQATPGQGYNEFNPSNSDVKHEEYGFNVKNLYQGNNPNVNNINGIFDGNEQNIPDTILDQKKIPIQLDRFTLNHDKIPYILEYIASLKNREKYNSNFSNNVGLNVVGNSISPNLSALGVTNPALLPNKAGIIELTYVLKRPKPLIYHPVYYAKYRLPYAKFIKNYRNLISYKPMLRSKPTTIYKDLISLLNVTEVSSDLQGYDKEEIINLMLNNGTLVTARLINDKDDILNEQLEIIQELNSNSTPTDINRLTNGTITHANTLKEKQTNASKFNINLTPSIVEDDVSRVNNGVFPNLNDLVIPKLMPINPNTYPNNILSNKPLAIPFPLAPSKENLKYTYPFNTFQNDVNANFNNNLKNPAGNTNMYTNPVPNHAVKPKLDSNNPFDSYSDSQISSLFGIQSNFRK